jgi:hypothetical protein
MTPVQAIEDAMEQEPNVPLWMFLTLLGALGSLLTAIGAIGAFALRSLMTALRDHAKEDIVRAERQAVTENEVKRVIAEIGDRKTGIRGWLHELANEITPRSLRRQEGERDHDR